jgi:DnaJ-class molecular chaperone
MSDDRTLFQILGVPPGTPHKEIEARFNDLMQTVDPNTATELAGAWEIIRDDQMRKGYHARLYFDRMPCPNCAGSGLAMYRFSGRDTFRAHCRHCAGVGFGPPIKRGK